MKKWAFQNFVTFQPKFVTMKLQAEIRRARRQAKILMRKGCLSAYVEKVIELENLKAKTSGDILFSKASMN